MVESKVSPTSAQSEKIPIKETSDQVTEKPVQTEPSSVGVYGIVKWYNCKFNYGFISRLDNKQDLFVHRNGIKKCNPKKFKSLMDGDIVMFDVYESEKGAEARNVTGPEGKPARPSRYAKFRPWYLEILRKTRALSLDDKPGEKNENFKPRQHFNKSRRPPQASIKNKDKNLNPDESKKFSHNKVSTESTGVESPVTDGGYVSKSPSENEKRPKKAHVKSSTKEQIKSKVVASTSHCHSCSMCEKATAVEV